MRYSQFRRQKLFVGSESKPAAKPSIKTRLQQFGSSYNSRTEMRPQELTNTATRAALECGKFEKLFLHPQGPIQNRMLTDENGSRDSHPSI
jgi:hypothetical protein